MSGIGDEKTGAPLSGVLMLRGSAAVLGVSLPLMPCSVMVEPRLLLRMMSGCSVTVMVLTAPGVLELCPMLATVKEEATTMRGDSSPTPRVIDAAEIGTSPVAEIWIMLGPVCGMVGLSKSNLTTVTLSEGTVSPGDTLSVSVPVFAAHCAVALKSALASRSAMVASGVTDPSKPEMVMVEFMSPVNGNCGWKDTVMVLVAPGIGVLWAIAFTVKLAER